MTDGASVYAHRVEIATRNIGLVKATADLIELKALSNVFGYKISFGWRHSLGRFLCYIEGFEPHGEGDSETDALRSVLLKRLKSDL